MGKLGIVGMKLLFQLVKQPLLVFRECHHCLLATYTESLKPNNEFSRELVPGRCGRDARQHADLSGSTPN
ncbi:hypothetical protein GCM10027404_27950 [Arthrobacter tumbae]